MITLILLFAGILAPFSTSEAATTRYTLMEGPSDICRVDAFDPTAAQALRNHEMFLQILEYTAENCPHLASSLTDQPIGSIRGTTTLNANDFWFGF